MSIEDRLRRFAREHVNRNTEAANHLELYRRRLAKAIQPTLEQIRDFLNQEGVKATLEAVGDGIELRLTDVAGDRGPVRLAFSYDEAAGLRLTHVGLTESGEFLAREEGMTGRSRFYQNPELPTLDLLDEAAVTEIVTNWLEKHAHAVR